jgi:GNAT superfamily N-acetyltransferase
MPSATVPDYSVRPMAASDEPRVLEVLAASLGWVPDEHYAAFFDWKHRTNPFGASYAWVAEHDGALAGFRAFMRWRFDDVGGREADAVRAVDTATHPDHRGAGVFSLLTRTGLDAMRADGVQFVFNTPNDQSRPGYLKMGWQPVGRLAVAARPRAPSSVVRMARARTPAGRWSEPCSFGVPAGEALADDAAVERLLDGQPPAAGLQTRRSVAFLRWRYAEFAPLAYRAVLAGSRADDGFVLFRLRRRGPALEAVVGDVVVPGGQRAAAASLVRTALRGSGADYALALAGAPTAPAGLVRVPRLGPVLTWRDVASGSADAPPLARWRLGLGDVELF